MQDTITNIFAEASRKAEELHEGNLTYVGEDGLRRCKVCGKKLETILHMPHLPQLDGMKVNCICNCDKARTEKIRAEMKQLEIHSEIPRRKAECFKSPEMQAMNFANDDSPNSEAGKLSRRWVAHYAKNVISGNIKWLFMYGGYGTGKSFYAACIANAMIERGYDVRMGTAADFEAELSTAQDKAAAYKRLAAYDVLILDDFASERKSDYMFEVMTNIVNDRYNARKAMIFTTNMSTAETGNPKDNRLRRIMSRVWKMGYPIELSGEDRRKKNWAGGIK